MIIQILVLVLLIILNGMFSASELAFLSLDKIDLRESVKNNNKKAIKIHKLMEDPSAFLATIQIAITLAGFLASAFAAETFADYIVESFSVTVISATTYKSIVVVIVTLILSYFTLVFGELVPKRIALAYPEKIAYGMVSVITVLTKIAYPFVWLLTASTNLVSRLMKIRPQEDEKLTEEEIKKIIATGKDEGAIESGEKEMIFNIFTFNDTEVKQIMTQKEDMLTIDANTTGKKLLHAIKQGKYTRLPVLESGKVIGILNVKDLLIQYSKEEKLDIRKIMRKPFFVKYNEKIDDVFRIMQKDRIAMAIVTDDYDNILGLVTLEDAIEEIVGNIYDEYDVAPTV